MAEQIRLREKRLVISRAIVDLLRVSFQYRIGLDTYGSNADEVMVAYATLIGTLEGRPLIATKIADLAGMPRSTARRRLRGLAEAGVVEVIHSAGETRYTVPASILNTPEILHMVAQLEAIIRKSADQLSNMAGE